MSAPVSIRRQLRMWKASREGCLRSLLETQTLSSTYAAAMPSCNKEARIGVRSYRTRVAKVPTSEWNAASFGYVLLRGGVVLKTRVEYRVSLIPIIELD